MIENRCPNERHNRKELALHEPLTLYQLKVAKYVFTFNYSKSTFANISLETIN